MAELIDFILHINAHLDAITRDYGVWTYAILFLIVFCETGLVVTPFLPGDSLLFAAGAICARGELNPHVMTILLIVAAIVGDGVNYAIGHYLGPKVLEKPNRFIRREYIVRTERFYEKYGGKAVVFARFVPIVRTFAPFLAGVGSMTYGRFLMFNILGGILWVTLFVYGGFIFGEVPIVKKNFTLVILGIIVVSVLPAVFEFIKAKREKHEGVPTVAESRS